MREEDLERIRYDADGLVPAIVQDADTRAVLMMAWMNAETLRMSLEQGRTVFWSRSRQEVWRKGDTSGDRQFIRSAHYDCDTGAYTCWFRSFGTDEQTTERPGPT